MSVHSDSSRDDAHRRAKRTDARDILHPGESRLTVVWQPPKQIDGKCALTKIENIKTFIRPGPHELNYGDTVSVKILDVGDSHAEALAIDKL